MKVHGLYYRIDPILLLDEGVNDGLVARFTADVTCIDINNEIVFLPS